MSVDERPPVSVRVSESPFMGGSSMSATSERHQISPPTVFRSQKMFDVMTQNRQFWSSEASGCVWMCAERFPVTSEHPKFFKVLVCVHTLKADSHRESTAMPIYAPTMQVTNETLTPRGPVPVDCRAQKHADGNTTCGRVCTGSDNQHVDVM